MIHECNAKIKNAAKDDRKQIHEECKAKIKELREKYKDLRAKLNEQFKELRDKFKSQMHEGIKFGNATSVAKHLENETKQSANENKQSEKENEQSENKSKKSDQGITNSAKEMKQFKELKNKGKSEDHKKGHQNKTES